MVSEKKPKMSQPIRGKGGHLVFPIGPKNTNLVEDVEILLPIKFCYPRATRCGGDIVTLPWFRACVCVCVRASGHRPCEHDRD